MFEDKIMKLHTSEEWQYSVHQLHIQNYHFIPSYDYDAGLLISQLQINVTFENMEKGTLSHLFK